MKTKQNILVSIFVGLAALSLAACAGAGESAELVVEPQQVPAAAPAQPTVPQAEPAVVVERAVPVQPAAVEVQAETEPVVSTTFVEWVPNGPMVEGAESTLTRMEHGFYATFKAVGLEAGDAYTLWWIIFNTPENCSNGECGLDDAFLFDKDGNQLLTEEGAPQWNFPNHAAIGFAIGRATGTVVDTDGTAEFRAHLPVGDANEIDFGPGLLNPFTAEVHLVIRTHGPVIPGSLHEQLGSAWGGCPEGWPKDPCGDMQISIHHPPNQ